MKRIRTQDFRHARSGMPPRARLQGQAMLEYLVVSAVLVFALFVPIKDEASTDKPRTAVEVVVHNFQVAYERMSFSLSIPE